MENVMIIKGATFLQDLIMDTVDQPNGDPTQIILARTFVTTGVLPNEKLAL